MLNPFRISPRLTLIIVIVAVTVVMFSACDYSVRVSPGAQASTTGGTGQGLDSYVAFVFPEGSSDIVRMSATVHEYGEELELNGARLHDVDGLMIVSMTAPVGVTVRPHFRFYDSSESMVAEYRAKITPDRRLITFGGQQFGWDEVRPHHSLPAETQLQIGQVEMPLGNERTLLVGDELLSLRAVGYYPSGGSDETLRVKTGSVEGCNLTSWTQSQGEAIPLQSDDVVMLESGGTLCVGVQVEANPEATAIPLSVSHF